MRNVNRIAPDTIRPKTVSGIDALYFYVKVDYNNYTDFYRKMLLGCLEQLEYLKKTSFNYEKQFTYFDYSINISSEGFSPIIKKLCTIGFKNLNQKDNNESIVIQMDSSIMQYLGVKEAVNLSLDLIRGFAINVITTKVSRVDLNTYVDGHNFEYLNYNLFSTKSLKTSKTSSYEKKGHLETFTIGSRSTDSIYLRIYNKAKELAHLSTIDFSAATFKELLIESRFKSKYGFAVEVSNNLWNVEFEVKRGTLRRYRVDTIEQLFDNVDSIHNDIMTNTFRLLVRPKDEINNFRIETSPVWNEIKKEYKMFKDPVPIDKEKLKVYVKDIEWLKNRLNEYLEEKRNTNESLRLKVNNLLMELNDLTT